MGIYLVTLLFIILGLLFSLWIIMTLFSIQNERKFFSVSSLSFSFSCIILLVFFYLSTFYELSSAKLTAISRIIADIADSIEPDESFFSCKQALLLLCFPVLYAILCNFMAKVSGKELNSRFFNVEKYLSLLTVFNFFASMEIYRFLEKTTIIGGYMSSHSPLSTLLFILFPFILYVFLYRPVKYIVTFGQKIEPASDDKKANISQVQPQAAD